MRDTDRIDRIVDKLRTAWHVCPDMRLTQLMNNLGAIEFHMEDDKTEASLDKFLSTGWTGFGF